MTADSRRRRLARLLRRFPWSGRLMQHFYRLTQPRFSVGVVGVLLDDTGQRVFLVEHVFHTRRPWGLPGGWIARGEDPSHAAEREFYEETGLRVRAHWPLLIRRARHMRGHMDVAYLCELDGDNQAIRLSGELLDHRWVPCDALPPLVELHALAIRAALDWTAERGITDQKGAKEG